MALLSLAECRECLGALNNALTDQQVHEIMGHLTQIIHSILHDVLMPIKGVKNG